jgi:hypothetical protein
MLFEPVALSPYGPWLAIADRGNGKIYFLNAVNKRDFFSVELPRPRDLVWSVLGELFVISEEGTLFKINVDFRDRRADAPDVAERDIQGGWTLFNSAEGDIYCLDIAASKLWKCLSVPGVDASPGFLSISQPAIMREENKESFILEARLVSPFAAYSKIANPVVYAVWNNRTIPSFAEWQSVPSAARAGLLVFHRPVVAGSVYPSLTGRVVENGTDIQIALPSDWSAQQETLTNILVDSSIIFSQDELDALTLFCLNNGLELDVWARSVPTLELVRAAGLTSGKIVYSLSNVPDLSPPRNKMQIRIPLPQELSSSGYPGRSMLTVYLDVGLMHTRDWIPLWPDLLE